MDLNKLELKVDNRGGLVEAFKLPNDGQVFYVKINPGQTRGDHYHVRKTERFLVISGTAEMTINNTTVSLDGDNPTLITVFPPNNHKIYSKDGCTVLVWVDEIFNEKDSDTYTI